MDIFIKITRDSSVVTYAVGSTEFTQQQSYRLSPNKNPYNKL